jgi:hypothetical protein
MMQKKLSVFFRDTNSKRAADQLLARSTDQASGGEIDLFNPGGAIKRDITDRGEIEKIDIPVDRLFELRLRVPKERSPGRFCHCEVVRAMGAVVKDAPASGRDRPAAFHD